MSNINFISAEAVKKSLENYEDVVVVDVRTPMEYEKSRIEGSINIPVNELSTQVPLTIPDKNKKIYLYCLSGSRSSIGAQALQAIGYINAYSMTSGLLAWRTNHFPLT